MQSEGYDFRTDSFHSENLRKTFGRITGKEKEGEGRDRRTERKKEEKGTETENKTNF